MTVESDMGHRGTFDSKGRGLPNNGIGQERGIFGFRFSFLRRGREKPLYEGEDGETAHILNGPDVESDGNETTKISNILYGSPGEHKSSMVYSDMKTIHAWRRHPDVRGHLYPRLQDATEIDEEEQRVNQWEYYLGTKNTTGENAQRRDSVFFKVINEAGEMTAVATLKLRNVDFVPESRTGYIETVIDDPDLRDNRIGTALLIEIGDYAYGECTEYQGGRGALALKATTIVDRDAGDFQVNELWLRRAGFKKDTKGVKWVQETPNSILFIPIQPWKQTAADYILYRPDAVKHVAKKQPEYAKIQAGKWTELRQRILAHPDISQQLKDRVAEIERDIQRGEVVEQHIKDSIAELRKSGFV